MMTNCSGRKAIAVVAAVSVVLAVQVNCAAKTLENDLIRVKIQPQSATFSVFDKRAEYLWGPPEGPALEPEKLIVPRAGVAGDENDDGIDWTGNYGRVRITPDMTADPDAADVDGPGDLSGNLRLSWQAGRLFYRLRVKDQTVIGPAADETEWWYKDSVEFWLGGNQYALRFGEWGCNVWSPSGEPENVSADWTQKPDGYLLQGVIGAGPAGKATRQGVAASFRFAIGINDCDGDDGRQGQLYHPATWVHSSPNTFARLILADEEGKYPQEAEQPKPQLTPVSEGEGGPYEARFEGTARAQGGEFPVEITFTVPPDRAHLSITIDTKDRQRQIRPFTVLHPLVLDSAEGRILAAKYCNGLGMPIDELSRAGQQWHTWRIDMPWVGLTDGAVGYMLLWELPVSCDNGAARLAAVETSGKKRLAPEAMHYPIKGKFAAPRKITYAFCDTGGHVAICKQYRRYAREHDILVTQREKMERKPQLARLAGAPDIWGRGDIEFCKEAKTAGIEHAIVNEPRPWDEMQKINELGYLTSRYDNYEDGYEGDDGLHGDFNEEKDVVIRADGSRQTAWRTMGDPPKQYMKRCSALYEDLARKWVAEDLEDHPYNSRFIDVTTACGLRECYHPDHPLTRTEDRKAKHRLAEYVGNELGLVLGGEHGRWWGADVYNYWEGMQSGGSYSWPAGHVGRDLPQTRDDIGKRYLKWGLGEKNRYPLWELVFHDCVVSTWYWGDSTGHLRNAAPDLAYKKDAFNILYGTVPLYWVTRPFSYRWSEPNLRQRLLKSYRNTCRLAEQVAFDEMTDHEFVTDDRAVQKSSFGDGTQVWVNFGNEPWTLNHNGNQYTLPQYGFYAEGPQITQYRLLQDDREVTYIKSGGYLHVSGVESDAVEAAVPVTMWKKDDGRLRVRHPANGAEIAVYPRQLDDDWPEGPCRVLQLNEKGEKVRFIKAENDGGRVAFQTPKGVRNTMILGPELLAGVTDLSVSATVGEITESRPIPLHISVANKGGRKAESGRIEVYADAVADDRLLAAADITARGAGLVPEKMSIPTGRIDGTRTLIIIATHEEMGREIVRADNRCSETVYVPPQLERWQRHCDVTVKAGDVSRKRAIVQMPFDPAEEWAKAGDRPGRAHADALRVAALDDSGRPGRFMPAQYEQKAKGGGTLSWIMPQRMAAGASAVCRIYMRAADAEGTGPLSQLGGWWHPQDRKLRTPGYAITFRDGYIRGIEAGGPRRQIIDHLGVSSEDTGWVDEVGQVKSFRVEADGPVFAKVRVKKELRGRHFYHKLYTFYPHHFIVATLSQERFGNLSRAYYVQNCRYADDRGNSSMVDGKGNGEGIIGQNPDPKWYATWTDHWGLCCVPLTPHSNITYWDGAAMGGIGFNAPGAEPAKVAYFIHEPPAGEEFRGPDFAAVDYKRATTKMAVQR